MTTRASMTVRQLGLDDIDGYLDHVRAADAESGLDGTGHSHPYPRSEPFDRATARDREVTRWTTDIDVVGWRRAWGLFDGSELVGHLYLAGGSLSTELHRVNMGMGIRRTHHRRGGGTQLLKAAIEWARHQSNIDWIDLGVFSDNAAAQMLYRRQGFEEFGRTPDRFRVDGVLLDDISMSLNVRGGANETLLNLDLVPLSVSEVAPLPEEYCRLRVASGLSGKDDQAASEALPRSLYAVTVRDGDRLIGMGRVVGDGLHVQVVDIAVHPDYQGRGLSRTILEHIMGFIGSLPPSTVVSLFADVNWLYGKFGFTVPESSVGMFLTDRSQG